jgi:hypothetical protein
MNVCATRTPVMRDHGGGTRAACWAADLAQGLVTLDDHEKAALPREEISVADEA